MVWGFSFEVNMEFEYTDEVIRKMQLVELEMLKEVDRICKENDIAYILDAGTLLGAYRHKGFIPWDDDVDVRMLREEYERFCEVCKTQLDTEKYFLQNHKTDSGYRWGYARILRNGTSFQRAGQDMLPMKRGIFIDIFPCDALPDGKMRRKIFSIKSWIGRKMLYSEVALGNYKPGIRRFGFWILHLVPKKNAYEIFDKQSRKYNKYQTKRVRCQGWGDAVEAAGFKREWFTERGTIWFEDAYYSCPKDVEGFLMHSFGQNYMTPPPIEQQKPRHTATYVSFPEE